MDQVHQAAALPLVRKAGRSLGFERAGSMPLEFAGDIEVFFDMGLLGVAASACFGAPGWPDFRFEIGLACARSLGPRGPLASPRFLSPPPGRLKSGLKAGGVFSGGAKQKLRKLRYGRWQIGKGVRKFDSLAPARSALSGLWLRHIPFAASHAAQVTNITNITFGNLEALPGKGRKGPKGLKVDPNPTKNPSKSHPIKVNPTRSKWMTPDQSG